MQVDVKSPEAEDGPEGFQVMRPCRPVYAYW